jgi:hypothetical protein
MQPRDAPTRVGVADHSRLGAFAGLGIVRGNPEHPRAVEGRYDPGRVGLMIDRTPPHSDAGRKVRLVLQASAAVLWALSAIAYWSTGDRWRAIYVTAMALSATAIAVSLRRPSNRNSQRG